MHRYKNRLHRYGDIFTILPTQGVKLGSHPAHLDFPGVNSDLSDTVIKHPVMV